MMALLEINYKITITDVQKYLIVDPYLFQFKIIN